MKHITDNIWYSTQKLGENWLNARGWLHIDHRCIGLEWHIGAQRCHAYTILGGMEREILISVAIPWLISVYLSMENFISEKHLPHRLINSTITPGKIVIMEEPRQIGFRIFDSAIWISIWEDIHQWSSKDPWWWSFCWKPADTLLGKDKYIRTTLSEHRTSVILPMDKDSLAKKAYPAIVKIIQHTHKRPRWFARHRIGANITPDDPIPAHAGKGENSYDLDDDFVFEASNTGQNPDEACRLIERSIMRDRSRYGWPDILTSKKKGV